MLDGWEVHLYTVIRVSIVSTLKGEVIVQSCCQYKYHHWSMAGCNKILGCWSLKDKPALMATQQVTSNWPKYFGPPGPPWLFGALGLGDTWGPRRHLMLPDSPRHISRWPSGAWGPQNPGWIPPLGALGEHHHRLRSNCKGEWCLLKGPILIVNFPFIIWPSLCLHN